MAKKVFLSAGHGGNDPGAVGSNGLLEKDVNLQTLLACKSELERHGVTVVCSRTKDENDPTWQECNEANAGGCDLAFSFHANASASKKGDGFEAYYYGGDENGKRLALLCEKYVKQLGQNSRGAKDGSHLYFIAHTNMTAVLVESFFIDNATDVKIGDTVAEQQAFGVAYAKSILEYFGITYKAATETAVETKGVTINGMNVHRAADFLVLYTGDRGDSTGTNKYGTEVAIDKYGVAISAPVYGVGNMIIPAGGCVLSGHGKNASWLLENIKKGTKVKFTITV